MQSIDSLRELNAKLLAEIAELRKKFSEIKIENDELKDKNTEIPELRRNFAEIEAERAELKARITKLLKQGVEENKRRDAENAELKARIIELEKNKTVNTKLESENAEFRDRITKVEQRQMQNDNVTKVNVTKVTNSNNSNNSSSNFNFVAEDRGKSLADEKMDGSFYEKVCFNKEEQMPEVSPANVPDSDIAQLKHHTPVYEANVIVPEITRESVNQDVTSKHVYVAETDSDDDNSEESNNWSILEKSEISGNFVNKIHNFHDQNIDKSIEDNQLDCNLSKNDSSRDDDFTVPSEKVVECDLMQQLSLPSISIDTEIPLTPPVIDKKQQFSVTAEFKINTAKQQVYQEVKKLLPDISDVNLVRQQLSRARKLYKLFNAVGVEKIKQVTYSANAISNLNNIQIQNIINYVLSKVITGTGQNSPFRPNFKLTNVGRKLV
ncbi:unnamed protein product [Rhizophagus irregularis]|nr:unnamed protein product [Rhizophagus irregularis]